MNRLTDVEVCITGRLAAMSREDAVRRIESAGGSFVAHPTDQTGLLVVGQDGPPLGEDGRMTHALREARRLVTQGVAIEIVWEREFLQQFGSSVDRADEELGDLYSIAQLAKLIDVSSSRVRAWIRHGLLRPVRNVRRLAFFDFTQLATARALKRWTDAGVGLSRIRDSLDQLRRWIPDAERSLSQLEFDQRAGPVVMRLEGGELAESSGQLRFDFEGDVAEPTKVWQHPGASVDVDWFVVGGKAEQEGRLQDAVDAYQRELDETGACPEVYFNLGNVYYAMGRYQEAVAEFQAATELDAEYVVAWNNLGNVLAKLGRHGEAVPAYRRALAMQPNYSDAHYNLAETLAALGHEDEARRHWAVYLRLDPTSQWAARVRDRLRID